MFKELSTYIALALAVLFIALGGQGKLDHEARKVARIHAAQVAVQAAQVAEATRKARQYAALERIEAHISPR